MGQEIENAVAILKERFLTALNEIREEKTALTEEAFAKHGLREQDFSGMARALLGSVRQHTTASEHHVASALRGMAELDNRESKQDFVQYITSSELQDIGEKIYEELQPHVKISDSMHTSQSYLSAAARRQGSRSR